MSFYIHSVVNFLKKYALWLVLLFVFFSGGYIAFREFYYFGTLNLYISEKNTILIIDGKGEYECLETFCSIQLFPKKYKILIKKEGFNPVLETININLQKTSEQNIYIQQYKSQLQWIEKTKTINEYNKGVHFPLTNSYIDRNIENLKIGENKLLYKKTPLLSITTHIFVSTDEIGRNAWIVSEKNISQFSHQQKSLFPVLQKIKNKEVSIKNFYPQKNGFFSWENEQNEKFYFDGKKNIPLEIDSLSLFTACKLPNITNENIWAYLSNYKGSVAFYVNNLDIDYDKKLEPLVFLENIYSDQLDYIECNSKNSIKGILKSGEVFVLSF